MKCGFLTQVMGILDCYAFEVGIVLLLFYANGRHILSAGQDRAFRLFSVIQRSAKQRAFSAACIQKSKKTQAEVLRNSRKSKFKVEAIFGAWHDFKEKPEEEIKLKPVISFDVGKLPNIAFVLGEHILKPCPENPTPVKACAISACGNFAVLGTAGGWIERFNLQSGISRGSYVDMSERNGCAHDVEVVGVACDSTNTLMISAGYHGDIKVWDFKGRELKSRWKIGCSLVKIVYHRSNGLLATVADDLVIRLFDVVALRMVRKFDGHTDRITDLCFSEDGKWLLSSSMDGSLRIWDVILARQIDAILVDVCITALSLSPNMDVLATTHVDQNGVYLWVNQAMFTGASNDESYGSGKEIVNVKLPSVSSIEGSQDNDSDKPIITPSKVAHKSSDQQIPDLVTLSLLPKSQWQSLTNLDIIKARNKPIEPPKKPEQAPFFLPSIPSLSGKILFKPIESANEEKDREAGKLEKKQTRIDLVASQFVQLLQSSADTENFLAFTDYIKSLSPSTLDVELRMLQIIDDDDEQELDKRPEFHSIELLLDYFIHEISCRNNFEFIQALIRLFLKIHGETIRQQPKLQDKAQKLLDIQRVVWQRVDRLFQSARCMALESRKQSW
ncbi:unnamed protein product [Camellia sinensis]